MKLLFLMLFTVAGCTCQKRDEAKHGAKDGAQNASSGESKKSVNLYIWSDYTNAEILKEFERQTGFVVQESNFSSNEELLAKLQAGATGYDVIIPSDYMISAMRQLDLLQSLDRSKIPNASRINPNLMGREYDPDNKVSLPYSWGVSGIAYHRGKVKSKINGWADLIADQTLKGRWSLLDDGREAISAALRMDGVTINSVDPAHLEKAKNRLIQIKSHLKSFTSTPLPSLVSGELLAAHMYSNEAFLADEKTNGQIAFVFPVEGGVRNIDNFAIPKGAPNPDGAHQLINFLLEPRVHADFVNRLYAGPVLTNMEPLLSDKMKKNPLVTQFDSIAGHSEMLKDLGENMVLFDRIWTEVKAAR